MNSKAIKRQLLAAIAMVLVAAIALGSSTYAWFANNNKVTADGLSIKAQSEGTALVISDTVNGTKAPTVGTNTQLSFSNAVFLFPTHVAMGTVSPTFGANGDVASAANAWTHATSDKYDTAISNSTEANLTIADGSATGVKKGTSTSTDGFEGDIYITDDLYIAVKENGANNKFEHLYVTKCDITSAGSSTLLNSARVLMVVTNGSSTTSYQFSPRGVLNAEGDAATIVTADKFTTLDATNVDLGAVGADEVHVQLFVYFDGRDEDCTSAKYDTKDISVSLEFTGADPSST